MLLKLNSCVVLISDQGHVSRLLNVLRGVYLWVFFSFSIGGLV